MINDVSQNNCKNLWMHAYHRYSSLRNIEPKTNDSISLNVSVYDDALREVISRIYCCPIVNTGKMAETEEKHINVQANTFPALAAIETNTHFLVIHDNVVENTLLDCVTFSPAILDDYNKPLFLIYQLLNLVKNFHSNGLLLGEINLHDIYMTENLWLQVFPQIEANVIENKEIMNEVKSNLIKELHVAFNLKDYVKMWVNSQISNFDYLTILNNFAGRRLSSPGYYHISKKIC